MLWELIKWSPKGKFSQLQENVWRSVKKNFHLDFGAGLKGSSGLRFAFFSKDDWDEQGKTVVRWSALAEGMDV